MLVLLKHKSTWDPRKWGRLLYYSRNQISLLQQHLNDLEAKGIFQRPEDVGVSVEYLNSSFRVKKSNGGFRLVTAFPGVGIYSKPQPSLPTDVDFYPITHWKYIAVTDLNKAFFQIPLSQASIRYCGVVTLFRGIRVYTGVAMGMPGSETALWPSHQNQSTACNRLKDL